MSRRAARRGFSLLEVMVAVGIVSMVGVLIYGTFMGMSRSRKSIGETAELYQQGRGALTRMAHELSSAFLSSHRSFRQTLHARQTAFIGTDRADGDRVDFTAFAHRRLARDVHESDQAEVSYFGTRDPITGNLDLVRRLSKHIDDDPTRGGVVEVLAENIDSLEIRYLDPLTDEWLDSWDTTQPASQPNRLPSQVWIILRLMAGPNRAPVVFQTKTTIHIQAPLNFANSN